MAGFQGAHVVWPDDRRCRPFLALNPTVAPGSAYRELLFRAAWAARERDEPGFVEDWPSPQADAAAVPHGRAFRDVELRFRHWKGWESRR